MNFLKIHWLLTIVFLLGTGVKLFAQNDTAQDNKIYVVVPQMPTFPMDLDNYMSNHLQYPQSAIDKGIEGKVNVTFVVTKTGDVTDVTILSGVSPVVDSEAVRVVKTMPPWNPGMKNGKAVNVRLEIPVIFNLNMVNHRQQQQDNYYDSNQNNYHPHYVITDTIFVLRDGLYVDPYIGAGEGGPQSSSATSTTPAISDGLNMKFGVGISYFLPSNVGISIGLQLQQFNFNYNFSNIASASTYNGTATTERTQSNDTIVTAGYNETVKYSFTYAQIPILCRYISSQENKLGFYAEGGFLINYLLESHISGTAVQTNYTLNQAANTYWYEYSSANTNSSNISMSSQSPNKLTFTLHLSAGILVPVTNKASLIFSFSPDFGLLNAGSGSNDAVSFGNSKYYLFGNGNYGSFNSYTFDVKLLLKLSGSSQIVHR